MITLIVNGKRSQVDAPADMPLLWVIREKLSLTGTKYGCGTSLCGACVVHHAAQRGGGQARHHYRGPLCQERSSRAEGMDRAGRPAVRLLSIRSDHVRGRPPRQNAQSQRRRHRRSDGGQHLPLRDVPTDPGRNPSSRPDQEGRRVMPAAGTGRTALSRRTLLKGGLAVGTGLVVGFRLLPAGRQAALAQSAAFAPNQWISIDRDGLVTIINSVVEM